MSKSLSCLLQHISITLQSNSSINWFKGHYQHPNTYFQLPLQMAAERESARYLANGTHSSSAHCSFCLVATTPSRRRIFFVCFLHFAHVCTTNGSRVCHNHASTGVAGLLKSPSYPAAHSRCSNGQGLVNLTVPSLGT